MNKRTDKELIQIALDNFDELFERYDNGLCAYFYRLRIKNLINKDEYIYLKNLIYDYIKEPNFFNKLFFHKARIGDKTMIDTNYFWKVGLKEPRKRYLEYLLTKVKQNKYN